MFLTAEDLAFLLLLDVQLIEDVIGVRVNFAPVHGEGRVGVAHAHLAVQALIACL
jgi:hypothetical protein